MAVKTRLVVAVALAGATAATAALLLPRGDSEPLAYPGSRPDVPFDEALRLALVAVPARARGSARYHVGADASVAIDFTASDEGVDAFLAASGIDASVPARPWRPESGGAPVEPPAGSGAQWEFTAGQRVETRRAVVGSGARRRRVLVAVNRSVRPLRVYVRSFPSD